MRVKHLTNKMFTENELSNYKTKFQEIGITDEETMKNILNYLYTLATVAYEILN